MKIAIITHSLSGGGAERVATVLANGLAERSHSVSIFAEQKSCSQIELHSSVRVAFLEGRTRAGRLWKLAKSLRDGHYDVVHTITPLLTLEALIAMASDRRSSTKVVGSYHRYGRISISNGVLSNLSYLLTPIITRVADKNICVSEGLKDNLIEHWGADPQNLVTIYNPVLIPKNSVQAQQEATSNTAELPNDYILYVGRFSKEKNPMLALKAFALLPARLSNYSLIMLGEGALRPKLEALARKLNISNKVIFKRYVTNPWPYYRNAKVLVSTSDRESFSLVLVESMACGLPVVATSSGGPQEILAAGRFGGLVPVGDEMALATAIAGTIDNPPAKASLQRRAAEFGVEHALDAYEELFSNITKSDPRH